MGVRSLDDLQMASRSKYLATLVMYRFIQSEIFATAYTAVITNGSNDEILEAEQYIQNLDKTKLMRWVKKELRKHNLIEILPVRDLRNLARDLKVQDYNNITKTELVSRIQQRWNYDERRNEEKYSSVA